MAEAIYQRQICIKLLRLRYEEGPPRLPPLLFKLRLELRAPGIGLQLHPNGDYSSGDVPAIVAMAMRRI